MKIALNGTQRVYLPVSAVLLTAILLVAGCAGAPEEVEELPTGPDPLLLENARGLIERGAPEHLREAAELLQRPADTFPEAGELAAFALALFDLLYPELSGSGYLAGSAYYSEYNGPYRDALDRARSGQAPQTGSTAGGEDFFDLVVPALFTLRRDPAGAQADIPELSGYLGLLKQAEAQNLFSVLPPYLQGRIYELQGDPGRAASLYRESLNKAASFYPGRQSLAAILLREGQAQEAVALFEESAELLPEDFSIRYGLAQAYFQAGQLEAASATAAQALIDDPDRPELMLLRARVLIAEGNWTQALRPLNLLLYQHPENREAYLLSARVLYDKAKHPEDALEILRAAETQFPAAAEFPELAGRIYLETGRSGEGLNKLQRALDLEPGRVSTLRLLLSNAMRMRRWLQAAIYLSEILEQEQSQSDLLQAIEIYESLGDSAQVLYYAEQLYRGNPTEENRVIYAKTLLQAGQTEQASALVEQGLEQTESSRFHSSLLTLKASLAAEDSIEEALALLREALLEHPENYEAIVKIAELYMEQRELRKASLYLKQAIALDPNNTALRVQLQSVEKALGTQSTR
ncbi:MAG: tetratricopeptide repeat protein [Spirochaetia bacterium]